MAPTTSHSAAVDFVSSEWESVTRRAHYKMNDDGVPILVEARPTHSVSSKDDKQITSPIQKIDSAVGMSQSDDQATTSVDQPLIQVTVYKHFDSSRLSSSEQQPSSSIGPSAHRSEPMIVNQLDTASLSSCFDQPQVEPPISNQLDVALEAQFLNHHVTVDETIKSGFDESTKNTPINRTSSKPIPSRKGPSIGGTAKDVPAMHSADTISSTAKRRTKVPPAARPTFDNIATTKQNSPSSTPIPSKHHDRKKRPSIGGTAKQEPLYTSGTISSTGKRRAKVPPAARSVFDNISSKNKPINRSSSTPIPSKHHGHKGPSTGDTKGKPLYSADTISNAAKRRTKVPPTARSGFDNIAKTKRNPPSSTPIPSMHHDRKKGPSIDGTKGKPMYSADTVTNAAKRRTKVPPTARSGFDNITKKNPTIPDVPSALPGNKNPLYNHVPSRHEQNALERMAKSLVVIAQQSRVCFLYTTACDTIREFEVFTTCMCAELMDRPAWRLRKSYIACLKAECLTLDVGHIQWQSRLVEAHTLVTSVLSDQSAKKMHPYATFIQLAVEFFTKSNKAAEIDSKDDEKLNETFMGELLDIIFKITSFAANATATKSLKDLLMEWNPPSWFSDQWPAVQQEATFFDSISWMMAMCACSSKYVEDLLIYKRLFLRLGLTPDATWNDVVRAFRRQTLALHEDKNTPEMSEEEKADRKRRYLLIDEAKNKLRDKLVGVDE